MRIFYLSSSILQKMPATNSSARFATFFCVQSRAAAHCQVSSLQNFNRTILNKRRLHITSRNECMHSSNHMSIRRLQCRINTQGLGTTRKVLPASPNQMPIRTLRLRLERHPLLAPRPRKRMPFHILECAYRQHSKKSMGNQAHVASISWIYEFKSRVYSQ